MDQSDASEAPAPSSSLSRHPPLHVHRLVKPRPVRGGRHRDVQGSAARAGVLGAGDGLITNISLMLGVAGASTSTTAVRVAGIAGLLAGAFSMAAGELVSVRAHDDLVKHEIDVGTRRAFGRSGRRAVGSSRHVPGSGVPPKDAEIVARILMANPDVALDTHARLELGVDPDDPARPGRQLRCLSPRSRLEPSSRFCLGSSPPERPRSLSPSSSGHRLPWPSGEPSAHSPTRGMAHGWLAIARRRRGCICDVRGGPTSPLRAAGERRTRRRCG